MDDRHNIKDLGLLTAVDELTVRRANRLPARQRDPVHFLGCHTATTKRGTRVQVSDEPLRRLKFPWERCLPGSNTPNAG